MIEVRFYVQEEIAQFVTRTARIRNGKEPAVWRELAMLGYRAMNGIQENPTQDPKAIVDRLDLILKTSVQNLTIARRLTGHVNEELVKSAKEDAVVILQEMEANS